MPSLQIEKTYTSSPFVDYLLYYTKILAFGSVVKDEDTADYAETQASAMGGDILISCIENNVIFELFTYTESMLRQVGITDPVLISRYSANRDLIPEVYRYDLTEIARQNYIDTYVELNPYYRMICGLPPTGDYGIPIRDYEYHFVNSINPWNVTYIHELDHESILYLEQKGILDEIRADYPDKQYLDYIACGITPYNARKAYNYQLLYYPTADAGVVQEKFIRKYDENRLYMISTFYSEGFKYSSKYYSNFIGLMIMLMTITDMLSEVSEHIVKKDLLDKRCIKFIFDMYGIPYYNSIPIKYQYRMCKNVNQLIRYKSSAQGMLNLIDLFGARDIEIFKYFILRDRNLDKWGDILYNEIETVNIAPNETTNTSGNKVKIIDHNESVINRTIAANTTVNPPYPFDNFLEYGNVMKIYGDDVLLEEDTDYIINIDNSVTLRKRISGELRYDFYYNTKTLEDIVDTNRSLKIKEETRYISSNTFPFNPPKNFISDGNQIIVSLGGTILGKDQYTINQSNNTITIDSSFDIRKLSDNSESRRVVILYPYTNDPNKTITTKFERKVVTATSNNQTVFTIPEPFEKYVEGGNIFFVTYRNTFIQDNRYTVNTSTHQLTFTDIKVPKGIEVVFHFIYAEASIYQDVSIQKKVVELDVTEDYQTRFSLLDSEGKSLYPIDGYLKAGYKVYVNIRNSIRTLDQDYYDVYGNTLALRDTSLCLRVGEKITVIFVYSSFATPKSLEKTTKYTYSTENYQSVFDIELPIEEFFSKYNGSLILDIYGNYLDPSDYIIDEVNHKLTITNSSKLPAANEKLNFLYIRNVLTENKINSIQAYPTIGSTYNDNGNLKPKFVISLPFANYFESGHTALVFHNSTLIDSVSTNNSTRAHYKTESIGTSTTHFIYVDDDTANYQASKDTVTILFVFNDIYIKELEEFIKEEVIESAIEDIMDDDLVITVPYPYSSYLDNGWYMFITDEDSNVLYRSDNDENGDDDDEYPCELIDGYLTFIDASKIPEIDKLKFHFVYFDSPDIIYTTYEEDYNANYTLKFIGIPLTQPYHNRNIMLKKDILPYDTVTLEDQFWDGVGYDNDHVELHNKVKAQILRKKFNYERTKYFGINYVINIAEMSFRIAYFYNMLYDKVLIEDNLNVKVPSIAPYKEFNIAHLFCYMTSLAYLFSGAEDTIVSDYPSTLFIKGFNFEADLDALKRWIIKQLRYPDDYNPVWDFVTKYNLEDTIINGNYVSDGNGQIKDMSSFIDIFVRNREIYDYIVKTIYKSEDYDIYHIWKTFYDTLMGIRYSNEFYRVTLTEDGITELNFYEDQGDPPEHTEGDVIPARTFSELLYYRDPELYQDIKYIKSIIDDTQRQDLIVDRISDIVYILEEYMNSDEFHNIYDFFPGVSGDSFVNYLFDIINFFKSYKVVLRSKGDYIVFSSDDPLLNTIKFIDVKNTEVHLEKYDYFNVDIARDHGIYLYKDDNIKFIDKISKTIDISKVTNEKMIRIAEEYGLKTTTTTKVRIWNSKNQIIYLTLTKPVRYDDIWASRYPDDYIFIDPDLKVYLEVYNYQTLDSSTGYILLEAEYGAEFFVYIKPINDQWTPGVLNIKYAKVFDEEIDIRATDAIGAVREVSIYQSENQSIRVYNSEVSSTTTFNVNYGSKLYWKITPSEGYKAGTIIISPSTTQKSNYFIVNQNTVVSATPATIKTYTVTISAPANENIAVLINNETVYVEENTSVTLNNIPYWTPYTVTVYSATGYEPGTLNVPANGTFNRNIERSDGTILITTIEATIIKYTVTVQQSAHQTITVRYNGTSYSEDGSFEVPINTHITVSIKSDENYIAGTLNITERDVMENIIINATPAIEAEELLITISSGNNQVITVVVNGEEHTSDVYVPFGSSYTSYITANKGYTTNATIINPRSNELRSNVVVYASADAIPNTNTITIINPDTVNQTVRVYVNNDQTEENVRTSTFTLESGNTIRAEVVSNNDDYAPGTINLDGTITVDEDIQIVATAPKDLTRIEVTVDTIDNISLEVSYNGNTYHSGNTFIASPNTDAYVSIIPNTGYETSQDDYIYTFVKDGNPVTLTAEEPVVTSYPIDIQQKDHQTIMVTGTARIYNDDDTYTDIENYTSTESGTRFVYNTEFVASIYADEGYIPGTLNIESGTVVSGITISATNPSIDE